MLGVRASYLKNYPVTLQQPDGSTVSCFLSGDEYFNWVHDARGYTLIRDGATGYLVYAEVKEDRLVSTNYVVGRVDPARVGLLPWQIISAEKRALLRAEFVQRMNKTKRSSGENPTPEAKFTYRTGTINNVVIYIRFSDDEEFSRPRSDFEPLFNDTARGSSLFSYYRDISNGEFNIPSTFYPVSNGGQVISYQDKYPRSYYEPFDGKTNPSGYREGENAEREQQLLGRALAAVKSQVEARLSAAKLDYDYDGEVDNVCFVIKGDPGAWSSLLWPHRWTLSYIEPVYLNGKQVVDYFLILENHLFNVGNGKQSVLVHETYHVLDAPDLYRYTSGDVDPVGSWDVMCYNTVPPQSSSVYISNKYGRFIGDIPELKGAGTYTVYHNWDRTPGHPIAYKILSPNSTKEYFVVEYRKKSGETYESAIPGEGLVFYRVNPSLSGNTGGEPYEVYVPRQGGTDQTRNGNLDLACFSANVGRTRFDNTSNPPCFLSDNTPADFSVSQISRSGGDSMTFYLSYASYQITASTSSGGNIYPSGKITVLPEDSLTFTITPEPGQMLTGLFVDGTDVLEQVDSGFYTLRKILASQNVVAIFGTDTSFCLPLTENFNSTLFPPKHWNVFPGEGSRWEGSATSSAAQPQEGSRMARFVNEYPSANQSGLLLSPKIRPEGKSCQLSFWMFRDKLSEEDDKINIYLSKYQTISNISPFYTLHRGMSLPPEEDVNQWHEYTFFLPTDTMESFYVIFEGICNHGEVAYLPTTYTRIDHLTIQETESYIMGVQVSPVGKNVLQGDLYTFQAVVEGTGSPSQRVTWTVLGGHTGTAMSAAGSLEISETETSLQLTVRATSLYDPTYYGDAVVNVLPLGTTQVQTSGWKLYPNPAREQLVIENGTSKSSSGFCLYDLMGRVVKKYNNPIVAGERFLFPTAEIPSGLYLLHIYLNEGIEIRKIVIEKK